MPRSNRVSPMSEALRVLFLCTHNSARSQMAEAFLSELGEGRFQAFSAGTEARGLHPLSIQAMAEVGIDISFQESKTSDQFVEEPFDLVITVCDEANEACPYFANARQRRHWSFPDPSAVDGDDAARFAAFAEVRDAIRDRIERELLAVPTP
ncbi:MAG: arsenate reductase ArsC [Chloroflexota bacterium]